jgi:predicted aldo/keto reductase-like oxidoreductase
MRVASCLRCGECEKRCPYRLSIRELLPVKMNSLLRGLEAQKLAQNTS